MKNHDFHKRKMIAVRCFSNTFQVRGKRYGASLPRPPTFSRAKIWISQEKAGGDATENDDFQIGKQPLQGTIFFKFDGGDLMKILFLQMKRYSEFARLCFRSERVFVMGGDPTKNCNFHRGKVGLLWSKNLNLVCRENCFANRDCSPNPPFPLHLMKCQPQCSAANSYFVPQQSMSTVTR